MVRLFPRDRTANEQAPGGRAVRRLVLLTAVLALLASVISFQTVAAAGADEDTLRERRSEVQRDVRDARGRLAHSSARLVQAIEALEAAEQQLDAARTRLARAQAELAAAEKRDREMRAKLEAAVLRLEDARAALAEGRQRVDDQRSEVAEWAAANFQNGGEPFLGLRVLLNAETPDSLTTQMDAVESVTAKNADRFDRLQATEVLLQVSEDEVEAARDEVAVRREAAARNLEEKKRLQAEARQVRNEVASLVAERATAKREAEWAKAADRRQVAALESERSRIEARLAAIAARRAAERRRQQAAGLTNGSGWLSYPVSSYITSPYGMRLHPILHYWKLHDGTDFGAGCGTPIRAADDGVVLSTYYNSGYGNRVIIDHGVQQGESLSTSYNHLSAYSTFSGQRVSRGEIIGYVGSTGYSTGCHLHFMVYENGATVDPMNWL